MSHSEAIVTKQTPDQRYSCKPRWFRLMISIICLVPWFKKAKTLSHVPFYKKAIRGTICYVMQEDLFFQVDKKRGIWWAVGKSAKAVMINDHINKILDPRYAPEPVMPMNADFTKIKFGAEREPF